MGGAVSGPAPSDGCGEGADRHAEVFQHLEVLVGGAAQRRQVVADDEGVDAGRHPDSLQVAQGHLASAGVAEDDRGQRQAEQSDPADGIPARMGRSPSRGPGRGLRKLIGTSVGSSSWS